MGFVLALSLLILGSLLATEYIVAIAPQTEAMIEKFEPYRGWFGLFLALTGLYWSAYFLFLNDYYSLFGILKVFVGRLWFLYFTAILPSSLLMLFGGVILGADKIAYYTGKSDEIEVIKAKLAPYQRKIGVASLIVGVWLLMLRIAWSSYSF